MRILVLTPEYLPDSGGGVITFYRELLPLLAALGHDVRVVCGSAVSAAASREPRVIDGVLVERLELARLRRHQRRFAHLGAMPGLQAHLAAAWALWEQAGEGGGADVVEACDWGLSFLPPVIEGAIPTVVQAHGSVGQIDAHDPIAGEEGQGILTRLIEIEALKRATAVQTLSNANAEFWRRQTGRHVCDIAPAWRIAGTPEAVLSPRGLVLGRVQRWKGAHTLCEALQLLGDEAPDVDWVGRDAAFGQRTQSCSAALAAAFPAVWGGRIRHLPQASAQEAARLQRAARFVIVPSSWDVFNFTCVEAMACGRPVICSSGAGASELIEDGVNGFVFESGDANGLAAALRRVLSLDEKQREKIGEAARETIRGRLDPENVVELRLKRYAEARAAFEPRPAPAGDWLREACSGRDTPLSELRFLDHLPLRPLLSYSARRLLTKVMP